MIQSSCGLIHTIKQKTKKIKMGWFYQLLFLQLLVFHSLTCASLCSHDQSSALIHFKQLFSVDEERYASCYEGGIPYYPKMETWKENTDCCSWDGVTCDAVTGHVIGLDLSCSGLRGIIPPNATLFRLSHLEKLNLAFNDFFPSYIHSGFTQFPNLTHLNLSGFIFVGKLPSEFSHLSKLVSLDLSDNYGVGFDAPVFEGLVQNLTGLEELILDRINMSNIEPSSLANISSSLTHLSLVGCGLRGYFPENIFSLPDLHMIVLEGNYRLEGAFPQNWSNPLRILDVSSTSFSGKLPDSIGNLKSLVRLNLHDCNFIGPVPASLGNLTQLALLDLAKNNFSGHIPSSVSKLEQLSILFLYSNNLTGEIPDMFANLTQLSDLDFSNNQLVGPIPSHASKLRSLVRISLKGNSLNGTIPSDLFSLPLLKYMDLSHNKLEAIENGEFQSNSLEDVDLSNNRLHGSIPNSIFELVNLIRLKLSSNNLSGCMELYKFAKLKYLLTVDLSRNSLSLSTEINSSFEEMVRTPHQLSNLDLSDNRIYGKLPNWMWEMGKDTLQILNLAHNFLTSVEQLPWKNLDYLDLSFNLLQGPLPLLAAQLMIFLVSNNQLIGDIPHSICSIYARIQILDLSYNRLSGNIPECMGSLSQNLKLLDLRNNRFHGEIPDTFAYCSNLEALNVNNNGLEGPLPRSLINCKRLELLDLGNNKFYDTFPYWLGDLPSLQVLVMRSNKFYGNITDSEADSAFSMLRIVDISNNKFIGTIPRRFFKNLNAMMNVDETRGLQYMGGPYYEDSITVTVKGSEIMLEKILTTFTTIDFSINAFNGEIPKSVGMLQSLRLLNFSHNSLAGHIPSSLGNLNAIESLDLSWNKLVGEIPCELASLNFLEVLNLSRNQLAGPIPRGSQFNTFGSDCYNGNLGLCGFPLPNDCHAHETPQPSPPISEDDQEESVFGFGWKVVVIGYGCGMMLGMIMGYIVFTTGKPKWLVRVVERPKKRLRRRRN